MIDENEYAFKQHLEKIGFKLDYETGCYDVACRTCGQYKLKVLSDVFSTEIPTYPECTPKTIQTMIVLCGNCGLVSHYSLGVILNQYILSYR